MSEIIQNPEATPNGASSHSAAILTGAALLGGAALFASPKAVRAQTKTPIVFNEATFGPAANDVKVLNFALSLEALETDLYVQALQRLTTGGTNTLGKTIVGLNQSNSSAAVQYLREFGQVETAHRNFLNGALGNASILAQGNALNGAKFDFGLDNASRYPNAASVVNLVRIAEATGVMAYIGAVTEFKTTTYLQTAAAIQGTEARHTAVITAIYNGLSGQDLPVSPKVTRPSDGNKPSNNGRDPFATPDQILNGTQQMPGGVRQFIVLKSEQGGQQID